MHRTTREARRMATETVNAPNEFAFQAEIKQLLHLLSHSLYQSRDIALRELISNASDALDKMRYVALTDEAHRDSSLLEIVLEGNEAEKRLVIRDNGVGMTREELVANLGTIARSGSREFLKNLSNTAESGSKPDVSLIGQFGVGFYSAFMIAESVRVRSRSYKEAIGHEWQSDGSGTFTISEVEGLARGTEVVLHLKQETIEFARPDRIKEIIRRYSGFVPHPILVEGEVVNRQKPIWVEPKSQVKEEDYNTFFEHLTHGMAGEKPLWHLHMAADSPIQFRSILYCPAVNPEKMGFGVADHGLSLLARRILVQGDNRDLLPEYFRFLYGLVDSEDLPLNVSRETLQDNSIIRKIKSSLVKGVIDLLQKLGEEKPEEYAKFYAQFGPYLKEGVARDFANNSRLAKLLRFLSSRSEGNEPTVSLDDYVGRMVPDQKHIYYLGGPDLAAIRKSPNLEIFRRKGIEVLFLTEPVDEFVMSALSSFGDKNLTSIDSATLDLPGGEDQIETPETTNPAGGFGRVLDLFREALASKVQEVRVSKRLTDSPCCLVNAEGAMSTQMHRILTMAGRDLPGSRRVFEVNPRSPLIERLAMLAANPAQDEFIRESGLQLWSGAMILEGNLPEPEDVVARMQRFVEQAAASRSSIIV